MDGIICIYVCINTIEINMCIRINILKMEDDGAAEVEESPNAEVVVVNRSTLRSKTFQGIRKVSANIHVQQLFTDDQFKMVHDRQNKKTTKRLKDLFQVNTSIFIDIKTGRNRDTFTKKQHNVSKPTYLTEINMLPFFHYQKIIEPPFISPNGYYHVAMWKDGLVYKEIIDDQFYFDDKLNQIQCHPDLCPHPWIVILIKAWAKKNKGYENLMDVDPFEFIKTFSYPDWEAINPNVEKLQYLIGRFGRVSSNKEYMVAQTKNDPLVGYYGFSPNCASFVVTGHYQQYGGIFIKLKPYVHDKWNGQFCNDQSELPEDPPSLSSKQFLIPSQQFLNVFHLLYTTNNKYQFHHHGLNEAEKYQIFYSKYTLALDARQSKAKVLTFQISSSDKETQVGLNIFFPKIKIFDLMTNTTHPYHEPSDTIVPWCKILIGLQLQTSNVDASYVESVREKFLDNDDDEIGFIASNNHYEYILGDYFKGYSEDVSYNLSLKPGKYFIRLKSEQKKSEYRCYLNTVSVGTEIKISDSRMERTEQIQMLKQTLSSKVRNEKKNITYLNKIKKGSWISCTNDFNKLGYCMIVAKTIQHSENKIVIEVDPKVLGEHGYLIKDHKDNKPFTRELDSDQSTIIILKHDKSWKQVYERIWPPHGIQFFKIPKR